MLVIISFAIRLALLARAGDEGAPQRLAERAIGHGGAPLPARQELLRSGERAVEAEALVDERLAQRVGGGFDGAPAQVGARVVEISGDDLVQLFEEVGHGDVDLFDFGRAHRGEIGIPVEVRRFGGEAFALQPVVGLVRVTPRDAVHRRFGELRLELHDPLRLRLGLGLCRSGELQHLADVIEVERAQVLRFLVVLEVVVAVGQAEPALIDAADHLRRILRVLSGEETEERAHAAAVERAHFSGQRLAVLDGVDGRELFAQGRQRSGLGFSFVHAGRVEIADFLRETDRPDRVRRARPFRGSP